MKVPQSARTGRIGVAEVASRVERIGWLFREQPIHDTGIDAIVEIVDDEVATAAKCVRAPITNDRRTQRPAAGAVCGSGAR